MQGKSKIWQTLAGILYGYPVVEILKSAGEYEVEALRT